MQTIYCSPVALLSREGLFNILCFRGAFYRSTWAKERLRWFSTYEEWEKYLALTLPGATPEEQEAYFVNKGAYGTPNRHRTLANIKIYWTETQKMGISDWESGLTQYRTSQDLVGLSTVLEQYFNIGKLTGLLIIGDLIHCGLLPIPSIITWAHLIAHVNKGAYKQLETLGMTHRRDDGTPDIDELAEVLQGLDDLISENTTEGERTLMDYNIVMLEHALCKFGRL
ncbi:hypothetical protein BDN72DRAFT_902542 [Pluteus cervinus]|uniref:Uncharacterized protein n=1 Tax=Pluteus cervinus TaxID=181527 RepID=A0ACD3ABL4_9AGAR|nr:hypothetical protein BDN72DRAFT_902542 [Pluteus cervinus]